MGWKIWLGLKVTSNGRRFEQFKKEETSFSIWRENERSQLSLTPRSLSWSSTLSGKILDRSNLVLLMNIFISSAHLWIRPRSSCNVSQSSVEPITLNTLVPSAKDDAEEVQINASFVNQEDNSPKPCTWGTPKTVGELGETQPTAPNACFLEKRSRKAVGTVFSTQIEEHRWLGWVNTEEHRWHTYSCESVHCLQTQYGQMRKQEMILRW